MIWNGLRVALAIFSGKISLKFGLPERRQTLRESIFTGRVQRLPPRGSWQNRQVLTEGVKLPPERKDFPRPGEDVTAGDKRGNLASRSDD